MARGGPKNRTQPVDIRDALRPEEQPAQTKADGGPTPVNLGDMAGLKRGLDDCAVAAILEAGYEEDFLVSNVKIGLGGVTIAIALLAQFYPKKYPDNWLLLAVCLALYAIGSAALSVFTALVEDDCFLITRPRQAVGGLTLRVASRLPRYSDQYSLVLSSAAEHKISLKRLWSRSQKVEDELRVMTRSLTEFYDSKGILHEDIFRAQVQAFVSRFEREHKKSK